MSPASPDPDRLDPALRFEVVPYRAEGGYSLAGFTLVLLLSLVGGVVAGAIASWIGQWYYLIVLFPIGMAAVVGLNQVRASIPRKDASGRFVFPSFWQSVRHLGVLADNGKVTWFKRDKAAIKKIKEYLTT